MANTATLDVHPEDIPAGLGGLQRVDLPATRYHQGERTHYHVGIPLGDLPAFVRRPDPARPMEGNRRVDLGRAKAFARYLREREDWVSPAIIVRIPAEEVRVNIVHEFADGTAWVVLSIPRRLLAELLDGQHRALGTCLAVDETEENRRNAREVVQRNRDLGNPEAAAEAQGRLDREERMRHRLLSEHISIDIALVGLDPAKQMFADINNNAKGVNPDFTTILDQSNPVNRVALALIETHPLLSGRVELGQSTRMSATNANLLGAKAVADLVRSIAVGGAGRVGRLVADRMGREERAHQAKVASFLDVLTDNTTLVMVRDHAMTPMELRNTSLLGSATMLRVLAVVSHDLTDEDRDDKFTSLELGGYFHDLEAEGAFTVPVDEGHPLWDSNAFVPKSMAPQARQGSIRSLADHLLEMASEWRAKQTSDE